MTREEAIADIKDNIKPVVGGISLDMAIEALEQKPCADAISKADTLKAMSNTWSHICTVAKHRKPTKGEEAVYSDMVGTVKSLSPVMAEPCGDAINRQEAINCVTSNEFRYKIVEDIKTLPSVTPKEKTGRWIHREDMDYLDENEVMHNHFMCKDCGFIHDFIDGHTVQYRYCPSCGAKMIEPQESEVQK